jgi:ABC-2 type transport system permease protein
VNLVRDTLLIFGQQLRLALRNPAALIVGLVQPVLYLAFFGPLLNNLKGSGFPAGESWRFYVPGLMVQLGLFGAAFVGFSVITDWRSGVIERMRVTPVVRTALLLGRVLRDAVVLVIQAVLLTLAGLAFGFRAPLAGVLITLGFVVLLALSLSSASYAVALVTRNEQALAPMLNTVILPLTLVSGIFLPMSLAPSWLNAVSKATPFRYVIDAMRGADAGQYATATMLEGILIAVGLAAVCMVLATRSFARETA